MKEIYTSPEAWTVLRHPYQFKRVIREGQPDIYVSDCISDPQYDKHFWVLAEDVDRVRAHYKAA